MTDATVLYIVCVSQENPLAVPVFAQSQDDFNRRIAGATNSLAQSHGNASVGDVKLIAGTTLPTNWLFCDGSEIERLAFPQLYAELGDKWGAGDGSATFNLPNFQAATPPVAATTTPATTISGGSVTVDGSVPTSGEVGGTGGNTTTGGRPRDVNAPPIREE